MYGPAEQVLHLVAQVGSTREEVATMPFMESIVRRFRPGQPIASCYGLTSECRFDKLLRCSQLYENVMADM